ncbi:MAG TPA: flagellar basal body-associated FliL family protein [Thiobacillaceae bacterium]|nr:flagellar basal body-associated FliL family protein [Thiobacillaceae bacterium]HNU64438.1 flagellar basal body-associated FliL family protein [Thiobacillaceae bacterium]
MAQEEAPVQSPPPGKKRKLLLIILLVVGVIVLLGVGLAYWWLASAPDKTRQGKAEDAEMLDEKPRVYDKLGQFTLNLADQESYLQTEIQLLLADAKLKDRLKARMPEVRDAMNRLLSSKTAEELSRPDGKDVLAREIREEINRVLGVSNASQGVQKALFDTFIIQ